MKKNDHVLGYSVHTRLREHHLRKLMPEPKGTFLDIGCGLGYLTGALGEGFQCVGVDYDASSLKINMGRGVGAMVRGSSESLPFSDDSFDVILCSEMLEHLPDGMDARCMAEALRILKPGGKLLITVPCLHGIRARTKLRNLGHDDPSGGEYHYRMGYTEDQIKQMVQHTPHANIKSMQHSMILLSELFMDLLKLVYMKKNKLKEHSDMMQVKDTPLMKAYKLCFPILHSIFLAEDAIFGRFGKGHILIVEISKG